MGGEKYKAETNYIKNGAVHGLCSSPRWSRELWAALSISKKAENGGTIEH